MQLAMNQLPGRTVLDIHGRVLGRVDWVTVDTETWSIPSFRLRLRREAARVVGLGWSLFRMPTMDIPTGLVMGASDVVILRAALDELHDLVPDEARSPDTASRQIQHGALAT